MPEHSPSEQPLFTPGADLELESCWKSTYKIYIYIYICISIFSFQNECDLHIAYIILEGKIQAVFFFAYWNLI